LPISRSIDATQRTKGQVVTVAWFEAGAGGRWSAVGGGATVEEATDFARASLPPAEDWHLVGLDDLYGD
jgi:hypothetical protein